MARRRRTKGDAIVEVVPPILGLIFLLGVFSLGFRQTIHDIGQILLISLVLGATVVLVYALHRAGIRQQVRVPDSLPSSVANWQTRAERTSLWVENPDEERRKPSVLQPLPLSEQLRAIDWFQFEKLMAISFKHQGYTVTRRGGAKSDGGIDLVIEKDGTKAAIQCKQWKTWTLGVAKVRELVGAMADEKLGKGILITLSTYSGEAKALADRNGIEI